VIVGVLGGGQLGRMLALAGVPLGLRFRFLEPHAPSPVDGLGEVVRGPYDDLDAVRRFGDGVAVATYEFENVPVASALALAAEVPVFPPPAALELAQDRLREKEGFARLGIPTAPWRTVDARAELDEAVREVGLPAVLKTRRFGYDGKGQDVLNGPADLDPAWERMGGRPLLLEGFVAFERELSILAVRGRDGSEAFYPLVENRHERGILVRTTAPARAVTPALQIRAERYTRALMEELDYVGVLALELFQVGDELLANELAPRVHNSGHWTQDGAVTCQFENHARAVVGLPLGRTTAVGHAVMLNLLGALPPLRAVLSEPDAHLHLYDKAPRPGRKLGHVNVVGSDPVAVAEACARIEAALPPGAGPG
jgi:5-(carboxyamino)imidazole ribonucleotide synthase